MIRGSVSGKRSVKTSARNRCFVEQVPRFSRSIPATVRSLGRPYGSVLTLSTSSLSDESDDKSASTSAERGRSAVWLARDELDDRDGSVRLRGFCAVGCVGRKDAVGERPESFSLSFVADDRRLHRDATERDVAVRPKVVKPRRVRLGAGLRGDDRDPVLVVEVDDRVAPYCAALG